MIEIQELRKQDYKKARQFATQGMHLYWYVSDKVSLNLYSRYFWNAELSCATRAYGAYIDDKFAGVLLADIKNEPKKYHNCWRTAYIRFFDWLQHFAAGKGVETYEKANQEMYHALCEKIRLTEKSFSLPPIQTAKSEESVLLCFLHWKKMSRENLFFSIQITPAHISFMNTVVLSDTVNSRLYWIWKKRKYR